MKSDEADENSTLLWYDYETYGPVTSYDRPVQFAGIRTTPDLEEIGNPVVLTCRIAPDYLPTVQACLIHRFTPLSVGPDALNEVDFARRIHAELAAPATCSVGYNAIRFDHEVTRFLFYRNLIEPYAWHWQDENSAWDILDLARAAFAFRPDGINWPRDEEGTPIFRLEGLAEANGITHESAHDALSDVRATIGLARLLRKHNPRLYAYYFSLRRKNKLETLLTPVELKVFAHTTGMIPAVLGHTSLVATLIAHPKNNGSVIVYDLRHDPEPLFDLPADELRTRLYTKSDDLPPGIVRPALKSVRMNKSPFVAPARMITDEVAARIGLDKPDCRRHFKALRCHPEFLKKVRDVFDEAPAFPPRDVDEDLYRGFIDRSDREKLEQWLGGKPEILAATRPIFKDPRLKDLAFRFRARNFPESLSPEETKRWHDHCRGRLLTPGEDGKSRFDRFRDELEHYGSQAHEADDLRILKELRDYAREVRAWLGDG